MQTASRQPPVAVVVDDDVVVRALLSAVLNDAGFRCVGAGTGMEGIVAVGEHQPILTILDVGLPGMDGFEVTRRIRSFSDTYVIMVSARNEEIDTLMGLAAGADDYLTKPLRPRELRARIEAMLRRSHRGQVPGMLRGPAHASTTTVMGAPVQVAAPEDGDPVWLHHLGLRLHPDRRLCVVDGVPVELTRSEFNLLLALMKAGRRVITKNSLALAVRGSGPGGYVSSIDRRAVEVHLANLRHKLHQGVSSPPRIETVRGVGYRLTGTQPQ